MNISKKFNEDKVRVLSWLEKYAYGYRNARVREDILPFVKIPERTFRLIMSELIHEGNACSSNKRGYWFFPLTTNDPMEIKIFKECQIERKGKAIDLITDCDKLISRADNQLQVVMGGQGELPLGAM